MPRGDKCGGVHSLPVGKWMEPGVALAGGEWKSGNVANACPRHVRAR